MKRSKRLLSLLLCIVMLLGMLPVSVLAAENETPETLKRYTVLVLDTSNTASFTADGKPIYTADTAVEYVKKAAKKFISSLVNADGSNYVAVVSFKSTASVVSGFTDDTQALHEKVEALTADEVIRDISAGLESADTLISAIPDGENVRKNVVLFTTGMTNHGDYSYSGKYDDQTVGSSWYRTDTGIRLYAYANHAIAAAEALKQKATLYTIGLFQTMDGMPERGKDIVEFFKLTTKDLATSEEYYYPVDDPDDLEFTFGDVAGDIVNKKKIITSKFKWNGSIEDDRDQEGTCYYSDDYFLETSTIENSHRRTMSLAFVLSGFSSRDRSTSWDQEAVKNGDKEPKWKNAKNLLCGIAGNEDYPGLGFDEETFQVNDFWLNEPTKDSIGVLAANKTLRDGSRLVALAIRGGGYKQEWASNFTIGLWDEHEGFAKAKRDTLSFLDSYLTEMQITGPIKLWIVGYSRSGVTANMVGGALDSGYQLANGATVAFDDLFVYAFEPPQGSMREQVRGNYSNIHNIVNVNDLVALVAPSAWGFSRYSSLTLIPSKALTDGFSDREKTMKKMLKEIKKANNSGLSEYALETWVNEFYKVSETSTQYHIWINWDKRLFDGRPFIEAGKVTVPTFFELQNTMNMLALGIIGSRTAYVADWQAGIREIAALVKGGSLTELGKDDITAEEFIEKFFGALTLERLYDIVSPAFSLNPFYLPAQREEDIANNVKAFVMETLSDNELWGTIYWAADVPMLLVEVLNKACVALVADTIASNTVYLQSIFNFGRLLTEERLFQPHYPDITLAWIMSMDSYYGADDITKSNQLTRVVHINCPVDISVYDSSGALVASIVGDEPQTVDGSMIPAFINTDGEKIVMLPPDETYELHADATADGSVNLAIQEYYFSTSSVNRLLDYFNIPVQTGEQIKVLLPELTAQEMTSVSPSGSSAQYQVLHNAAALAPSDSYTGEDAQRSYEVTVTVDGENGMVNGGGTFAHGTFAQLEAFPANGAAFLGWYLGETLVSTELTYRFAVTEDLAFTAKFGDAAELYTLQVSAGTGGSVKNVTLNVPANVRVNLVAVADEGYTFASWRTDAGTIENAGEVDTWFTMPARSAHVFASFTKDGGGELPKPPVTPSSPSGTLSQPAGEEACPSRSFTDVDTSLWYHEAIDYVLEKGYMNGTGRTLFEPNGKLTRAMLVQILYNMEGKPAVTGTVSFKDVPDGTWYQGALAWAAANEIVLGYSDGTFHPGDPISREQLAAILFRYHGYKGRDISHRQSLAFTDAEAVSAWAQDAMQWAVAEKIVNGKGQGLLDPHGKTTRAQAAQMLMNYQKSL